MASITKTCQLSKLENIAKRYLFLTSAEQSLTGELPFSCTTCATGKDKQAHHDDYHEHQHVLPGETIYINIIGPISPIYTSTNKYIVTVIDRTTRCAVALPTTGRAQITHIISTLINKIFNLLQYFPSHIRTNNAKKYLSLHIQDYLNQSGTSHETFTPYQPQNNTTAKRLNHTLEDAARSALYQSKLPPHFWNHAFTDAVFK